MSERFARGGEEIPILSQNIGSEAPENRAPGRDGQQAKTLTTGNSTHSAAPKGTRGVCWTECSDEVFDSWELLTVTEADGPRNGPRAGRKVESIRLLNDGQ